MTDSEWGVGGTDCPPRGYSPIREEAERLAKHDPEPLRKAIVERGAEAFADGLVESLKPRVRCDLCAQKSGYNRWAFTLFGRLAKLTQTEPQVLIAVLQQYGVRDESEMLELVTAGRRLRSLEADASTSLEAFRDEALTPPR